MRRAIGLCIGSAALALGGCSATNPPLMFGDTTTYGLRLGNDGSTGGGSVALGYKAQSIAIVPVTYLDGSDNIRYLNGNGTEKGDRDGMSVFASFESRTPKSKMDSAGNAVVQLGQVFSTGLAAQQVTLGYLCRESSAECSSQKRKLEEAEEKARTEASKGSTDDKERRPFASETKVTADITKGPYQAPLLFARTDVIGIDIGGSLAQQGLQFVLGANDRSIAFIPTTTRNAKGDVQSIMGADNGGNGVRSLDALSVLGQFQVSTEVRRLGFGLERYFATGFAARNLGLSLGQAIADTKPNTTASQPPTTDSATAVAKASQ